MAPEEPIEEERRAEREEQLERELAHMRESFEKRKTEFMEIVDTYLDLPMEERPDYLEEAMKSWRESMMAEREAAGLPERPQGGPRLMMEFWRQAGENLSEGEQNKVTRFIGDVIQSQVAKAMAGMAERRGDGPPGPPGDAPPRP